MKYKINKNLFVQNIDGKIVIFNGEEFVYYTLNETAGYVFKKIRIQEDEEKIVNAVVKRYQIKQERANKDLRDLVSDLKNKKIISSQGPKK